MLEAFGKSLNTSDPIGSLRAGLIGEGIKIPGPDGEKRLVYADYVASGRALRQVEDFVAEHVLPYYANSHTESSYCGAYTTRLREAARSVIACETNAGPDCSVIFSGSGATSAVNRLVSLCGIAGLAGSDEKPTVFIGPYEHHSNILPWREAGAEVVEIAEGADGGPDLGILDRELSSRANRPLLVGAFSAASNVTGILTDVDNVTAVLKRHGALAFWDYAGGAPYLPIDMAPAPGLEKDAVVLSAHKFAGGPGASGILIVRDTATRNKVPTWPGGGSVSYVSPWAHDYFASVAEREEAGTPNIIGDIRAGLVFMVKAAIGADVIAKRDEDLRRRAETVWRGNPNIDLLGLESAKRLPIFSFRVRDGSGGYVHHQLFTRMLSDRYGIQARGGCVCAGPYGHLLLHVGRPDSERIRKAIGAGHEIEKPGWVRLNFSYLMDDETADFIIESVDELARDPRAAAGHYACDEHTAQFTFKDSAEVAIV